MQSKESFLDTFPQSLQTSTSSVPKGARMWKRYSVLGGIALSLAIGMSSTPAQATCNHLQGFAYVDCVGTKVIDPYLNRIDPPERRRTREACQQGDGQACDKDRIERNKSIGIMQTEIDRLKRQR
jgi:hypothetical protein